MGVSRLDIIIFIQSMDNMGGTEVAAINLVEAFDRAGINAKILSLQPYSGPLSYVEGIGDDVWTEYSKISESIINKIFFPKPKYRFLKQKLENYCKVHSTQFFINFTYGLFPANPGNTKTAAVIHWSVNGYEHSIRQIIKRKNILSRLISTYIFNQERLLNHRVLQSMDYIITLTNAGKNEIKTINKDIKEDNIKVIPNFLKYSKKGLNISTQTNKRIFFVGRLSIEKGCYRLLDIWQMVNKNNQDWTLEIFGFGHEENGMKQYIVNNGINNVIFHGFIADMSEHYPSADIILCTSDSEGFGLVLIEAMQYGVIPVTFDCPVSPRELIADGGEWVECFDIKEFARKVNYLCKNRQRRLMLQQNSIKRSNDFLEENVIKLWQELI